MIQSEESEPDAVVVSEDEDVLGPPKIGITVSEVDKSAVKTDGGATTAAPSDTASKKDAEEQKVDVTSGGDADKKVENDQDDAKTVVAGSRPQKVSEDVGAQSEYTAATEKVDKAEEVSQGKTRIVVGVAIGAAIILTAGLLWRKYKS